MLVLFAACEKVSDLSDEASVVDFQVLSHTPESAVLSDIYMDGPDIIIPVEPQEGLFPFSVQTSLTTSSTTHKVLGGYTEDGKLTFSSGESEVTFYLIAESGYVHPYVISLYPMETGADIKAFTFDGSDKTTVILDPWNAIVYISQFAGQVAISPWQFLALACILLALIVLVVVAKAWRIANENPVESIKSE